MLQEDLYDFENSLKQFSCLVPSLTDFELYSKCDNFVWPTQLKLRIKSYFKRLNIFVLSLTTEVL